MFKRRQFFPVFRCSTRTLPYQLTRQTHRSDIKPRSDCLSHLISSHFISTDLISFEPSGPCNDPVHCGCDQSEYTSQSVSNLYFIPIGCCRRELDRFTVYSVPVKRGQYRCSQMRSDEMSDMNAPSGLQQPNSML